MNHEAELIKAFFAPTKRERYLDMVANPTKRQKFLRELYHFKDLDPRYCFAVPKGVHTPDQIAAFLHQKGAPASCRVLSTNAKLDGKEMPLLEALRSIRGSGDGSFLSCIPGRLGYFEDEEMKSQRVLQRHN